MREITQVIKAYKFSELSDSAKENAIQKYNDTNEPWWHDYVYEDAKEIGKMMGIHIDNIYFSGFWSQGDGACFTGYYHYEKGSVKNVIDHAPMDEELHRIVRELFQLQSRYFFQLTAAVEHRGHYYHEHCTVIQVENQQQRTTDEAENGIAEFLRDYMSWIYKRLEEEYNCLVSEEYFQETAAANDWEFDEGGTMI